MFIEKLFELLFNRLRAKMPKVRFFPVFPDLIEEVPLIGFSMYQLRPREFIGRLLQRFEDEQGHPVYMYGMPVEYTFDVGLWARNSRERDEITGHFIKHLIVDKEYFRNYGIEDIELTISTDIFSQTTTSQKGMNKTHRILSRKLLGIKIFDYVRWINGVIVDYEGVPIDGTTFPEEHYILEILPEVMLNTDP